MITDFSAGDTLEFSTSAFASFSQGQDSMDQIGNDTVIALDGGTTVTLRNVVAASLTASDFHFV